MPRTFQGRLTVAFVAVIALTLFLVTVLVLNRLDAWFTDQQNADLRVRSGAVAQYVALQAELAAAGAPVVGLDNEVNPVVVEAMADARVQHIIADYFGQADVRIEFGQSIQNGETSAFIAIGGRHLPRPAPHRPDERPDPGGDDRRPVHGDRRHGVGSVRRARDAVEPVHLPCPGHRQRHRAARGRSRSSPSA